MNENDERQVRELTSSHLSQAQALHLSVEQRVAYVRAMAKGLNLIDPWKFAAQYQTEAH